MSSAEGSIQRAVFAHLRARGAPGVFAFHPANGGHRKSVEAAMLEGLGAVPGTPDAIALYDGCVFDLELKVEGTPRQREALAAMEAAGVTVAIAEGLDRAHAALEGRRLSRGRAS
jgi:hypothetical protein